MILQQGMQEKQFRHNLGRKSLTPAAFIYKKGIDVAGAVGPRPSFGDLLGNTSELSLKRAAGIPCGLCRRGHLSRL